MKGKEWFVTKMQVSWPVRGSASTTADTFGPSAAVLITINWTS
jgi:hypothetical protein